MALGVTEANAVNRLLWVLLREGTGPLTAEETARVEEAALLLAGAYRKRMLTGRSDDEVREGLARFFAAPSAPAALVVTSVDRLEVAHVGSEDGIDVVMVADYAVSPSRAVMELPPLDALDLAAELVVQARHAIDTEQWGEAPDA